MFVSKAAEIELMDLEGSGMTALCTRLFLENQIWSIVTAANKLKSKNFLSRDSK
jgi:hypothetical protein